MAKDNLPHPKGMPSFWRTQIGSLDLHRTTPNLPGTVDVVIVGAGYSAASLVTHLIRDPNCPSLLVLEARQLCSGATGRNGGHVKPDGYYAIARYAELHGLKAAAEVADFERANVDAVSKYVTEEKVDCDFVITRAIDVQLSDSLSDRIKRGYESLVDAGLQSAKETFAIPAKYAERVSGVKGAKSAYSYTAAHLWPYKLIHHMFARAIEQGVNLQTETPVHKISDQADSAGYWSIHTARGVVKARKVIMTTNAYTAAILREYQNKIIPYRAICCRIECPGPAPHLNNSYALRHQEWDFDYLIPRPDGSIVVGGARGAYLPRKEDWYGQTDDSTLIESAKEYFDGYMQRHFLGWEDSGAFVSDIWTGIMGYSSDKLPRVGRVPNRPGMFIMAGFTGHGMPQIFLTAKGIAEMVIDDIPYEDTGIPSLFKESEARLQSKEDEVLNLWKMSLPRTRL